MQYYIRIIITIMPALSNALYINRYPLLCTNLFGENGNIFVKRFG